MDTGTYIVPETLPTIAVGEIVSAIRVSETHNFGNEVVSQPLEDGTALLDHIIIEPDELEIVIHCSNVSRNNNPFPSQTLYAQLKQIRNQRELCTIYTRHEIYKDMAITRISAPNNAPFVDRVDFTVGFKRVDKIADVVNIFNFERLVYNFHPETERKKLRKGYMPDVETVYDSAKDPSALGQLPLDDSFPEPFYNGSLDLSVYDNVPEPELKTSYSALQNTLRMITEAYRVVGNLTQRVSNLIQKVSDGIIFVSNLAPGARSFYTTIKGQVVGIYNYFDVLTNDWHFNLLNAEGENMVSGATSCPNVNSLHGLHPKYKAIDSYGNVVYEDLAIVGFSMTEPIPDYSTSSDSIYAMQDQTEYYKMFGRALENQKGIESSIFAFTKNESGVAPCSYYLFSDKEALDAYHELLLGLVRDEQNFDFDDLDYSILIPPSTKLDKLERFLRRLNGTDLPTWDEVPDDCEDVDYAAEIEQALIDINSDSIDFTIPVIPV